MEITAKLRHLHLSPRKVRLVAGVIKGMGSERAELELRHRMKRASEPILKLIRSAAANARHNLRLSGGRLTIKDIRVNAGPTTTKYRPRAFGRAAPIRRRTSHVTLVLEAEGGVPAPAARREAPAVREVELEDLRGETVKRSSAERPEKGHAPKPKLPGFIRRIFQRKAI